MVMEHAGYGSLQELIQYTKCFNEMTAFSVFVQVSEAVKLIHERGVAHLDIKESNILLAHCDQYSKNPMTGFLPIKFKLIDFGVSF